MYIVIMHFSNSEFISQIYEKCCFICFIYSQLYILLYSQRFPQKYYTKIIKKGERIISKKFIFSSIVINGIVFSHFFLISNYIEIFCCNGYQYIFKEWLGEKLLKQGIFMKIIIKKNISTTTAPPPFKKRSAGCFPLCSNKRR